MRGNGQIQALLISFMSNHRHILSYLVELDSTTPPLTSAIRFASGVPVITVKTQPLAVLKTNGAYY